ncbi:hypothetical protein RCL1_003726 [Eukaryota sp. TZLM3-RCL]
MALSAALYLYGAITLVASFVCSLTEAAFLSIPAVFVEQLSESHNPKQQRLGKQLTDMKTHQNATISVLLTFNTLANTVGAGLFGAELDVLVTGDWNGIPKSIIGTLSFALLVLLFGEIVPKSLGARFPSKLTGFIVSMLKFFSVSLCCNGFVYLCTKFYSRFESSTESTVSKYEILGILKRSAGTTISSEEVKVIDSLFRLDTTLVGDICTPRTVMTALSASSTIELALKNGGFLHFSRIPVFESFPDRCIGYVASSSLIKQAAEGNYSASIRTIIEPLPRIIESESVQNALNVFIKSKTPILLVVGEFEETVGILSVEDVIETLYCVEIQDENDQVADMQELAKSKAQERIKQMIETDRNRLILTRSPSLEGDFDMDSRMSFDQNDDLMGEYSDAHDRI